MPDAKELLHSNLHEVFSERDPERRRAAIERTYTEDVTFIDPEGEQIDRTVLLGTAGAVRLSSRATDGIRSPRSRRGPCQRFARNCATRSLTSPRYPTLGSTAYLRV
jgi:hypothetical protein